MGRALLIGPLLPCLFRPSLALHYLVLLWHNTICCSGIPVHISLEAFEDSVGGLSPEYSVVVLNYGEPWPEILNFSTLLLESFSVGRALHVPRSNPSLSLRRECSGMGNDPFS